MKCLRPDLNNTKHNFQNLSSMKILYHIDHKHSVALCCCCFLYYNSLLLHLISVSDINNLIKFPPNSIKSSYLQDVPWSSTIYLFPCFVFLQFDVPFSRNSLISRTGGGFLDSGEAERLGLVSRTIIEIITAQKKINERKMKTNRLIFPVSRFEKNS